MGAWEDKCLPVIAMVCLQFIPATVGPLTRAALLSGMNPKVFIFYRQAIATLVISPVAFFTRRKSSSASMGVRSFLLIFATAFIGVMVNYTLYFEGLYLASSSVAGAMFNVVPAVTFLIAAIVGLEQVNLRRLSSLAKILGTILCVGGAVSMAFLKGPKLLNSQILPPYNSLLFQSLGNDTWLLGCILLFSSMFCWALWLILQVPITKCYPDPISLSAWMCFLSMLQAGVVALILERDPNTWNLSSSLELASCFFAGVFGSGVQFFIQSWCISRKGPVFSAMFTPLCTVIATIWACIFLHEQIYLGSLIGAIGVVVGLYVVLWGKFEESKAKSEVVAPENSPAIAQQQSKNCTLDLEQPLLTNHSNQEE